MSELVRSIIQNKHSAYKEKKEAWKRNERRFEAGDDVYDELTPFQWESKTNDSYRERQARAVYPELPAQAAERFVGTLQQEEPAIDWGTLGEVREERTGELSRAEQLVENADGAGADARSWDQFWSDAMQAAMATKYRWVLVEAPAQRPQTRADELNGLRPYLVEYSPTAVPDWHYESGTLQYARIEFKRRKPQLENGKFVDKDETIHYLLVREGFTGFGEDFSGGGWWMFDEDGEPVPGPGGEELKGDWAATGGEIPMFRLYYEKGRRGDKRTGITHLGNIAISYMEVLSWMYNDAWVSGGRQRYFLGASADQWDVISDSEVAGGVSIPVPADKNERGVSNVSIYDTGSVSAHGALVKMLEELLSLALKVIMRELSTSPDASGKAREIEFIQGNSPRLAYMAGNMEEAQGMALRFLEMRWMREQPQSGVTWPKQFDLETIQEKLESLFAVFDRAGAQSATLTSGALTSAAEQMGLLVGEVDADTVRQEVFDSMNLASEEKELKVERVRESIEADRARRLDADGAAARRQAIEEAAADGED